LHCGENATISNKSKIIKFWHHDSKIHKRKREEGKKEVFQVSQLQVKVKVTVKVKVKVTVKERTLYVDARIREISTIQV